jgi:hypothetical protein
VLRSFRSNLHGISGFVSHERHIESIGDRHSNPRGEHQQTQSFNWGAEARTTTDFRFGLPAQSLGYGRGWKKAASKVSAAADGVWGSSVLRQLRRQHKWQRRSRNLSGDGDRCVNRRQCRQPLDSSHSNGNLTNLDKALPATFGWPELFSLLRRRLLHWLLQQIRLHEHDRRIELKVLIFFLRKSVAFVLCFEVPKWSSVAL